MRELKGRFEDSGVRESERKKHKSELVWINETFTEEV